MTRLLTLTLLAVATLVCQAEEGVPQPPEFNYGAPLPSPADYNYGAYSPDHYSSGVYPFNANFHHAFGSRQDALDPLSAALLIGGLNAGLTTIIGLSIGQSNANSCNKINEILNVASLGDTTDDAINPSTGSYNLASPAIGTAATVTPPSGISLTSTTGVVLGTSATQTALSLENFNTFRTQVATAISTLDKKIDEVLNKATLTC